MGDPTVVLVSERGEMENSNKGLSTPGLKVTVYGVLGGGRKPALAAGPDPRICSPTSPFSPFSHCTTGMLCASVQVCKPSLPGCFWHQLPRSTRSTSQERLRRDPPQQASPSKPSSSPAAELGCSAQCPTTNLPQTD